MVEEKKGELTIDELSAFCKRKGFVFKSSEIYGFSWIFRLYGDSRDNNSRLAWSIVAFMVLMVYSVL